MGSIVKFEVWAETRSAESAETTTKERILEQLLIVGDCQAGGCKYTGGWAGKCTE